MEYTLVGAGKFRVERKDGLVLMHRVDEGNWQRMQLEPGEVVQLIEVLTESHRLMKLPGTVKPHTTAYPPFPGRLYGPRSMEGVWMDGQQGIDSHNMYALAAKDAKAAKDTAVESNYDRLIREADAMFPPKDAGHE